MVDTQSIEKLIKRSGKKKQFLADQIGCSRQYFTAKVNNKVEFNLKEVAVLCEELGIKTQTEREEIFFCTLSH